MISSGSDIHSDRMTRERRWERNKEIVRLCAEDGLLPEEVAARFGLCPSTVFAILRRHGVRVKRATGHQQELGQRNHEIARLYGEGLSVPELGARFRLSPSTIATILTRRGVSLKRLSSGALPHLKERNDEIVRLYEREGLTLRQIGRQFDLSPERVRQLVRRAGVPPRRSGERFRERDAKIVRLYVEERLTLKDIGARFGLSQPCVSQIVSAAGMSRGVGGRKKGTQLLPAEERRKRNQEIVRLYTEGHLPAKEVAARFGLTEEGVLHILSVAGVRRRSRGWRADWPWRDANDRNDQIIHAYVKEGLSPQEIGTRLGLSRVCVRWTLDRSDAIIRSKDIARNNHEIIRAYLEEGLTAAEVAGRFSVTPSRVRYILRRAHTRRGQASGS